MKKSSLLSSPKTTRSLYQIFEELIETKGLEFLVEKLSLHKGTLKRWIEQKKVPNNYENDILLLIGEKKPATTFRQLDQFYTKNEIAEYCYKKLLTLLSQMGINKNEYTFIEPSVGEGSFYNIIDETKIGIDIAPKLQNKNIKRKNYLDFVPKGEKFIVIGNPPFGLRGNMALRFINHSSKFADVVAFILPPLFNSDGKGVPKKRVVGYSLVHSENLPANSYVYPDGKEVEVATIFQVWSKVGLDKFNIEEEKSCKDFIKIYSLSDGGTPSSTRNKKMLYECDAYLPSTCFTGMKFYSAFDDLPHRRGYGIKILKDKREIKGILQFIDWTTIAFRSTNGALNLRTSLIEQALVQKGKYDGRHT